MMKKVITRMLAFAAVLLCGGAWAAAPVAIWTNFTGADADAGITSGGCTLKANGNTVASDGSSITIGSSGVVVSYGTAKSAFSVVVKYSSLNLASSADQAIFTCQNGNNNNRLGFHMTANAAQLKGIADGADYGNAATTTLRASDMIAFTHKNDVGTYLYRKGDASAVCGYSGLKYGSNSYNSTTIGGMTSSTTFAVAADMVIEAVAVFDTNLSAADFNTFTFEKEMLYYFPLDGNKDNVGGVGNLTLTKGGSTDEANFWNDGGALSSDKCYKNNSANQGYILGDGSSPITSFAQGWTLSWWVKPNDLQNWRDICGFHIGATGYKIEKTDANKLQVYNNSSIASLSTPIDYTDNNAANWIHIAFVSNADGETVSVYGNGTYVCNLSPNGATKLWGNGAQGLTKVAIGLNGLYNINGGICRNAMVDEVAIYNFSATAAQIAYLAKNKPAAALGASGDKFWTGAAGDGNWNTAGNWSMDRAPTAEDDVVIINPTTITLANDSTAKSIGIEADVTFAGQIVDGNVNNVKIASDKTLTVNYTNTGSEGGIRNVIGGTLVKTGGANLRLANANGSAVNGTKVIINDGKVILHNSGGGDAVTTDPTFVINTAEGLTNWGWFTVNGTITLESELSNVVAFREGVGMRAVTKIIKKGSGTITLNTWKKNSSSDTECTLDAAIDIQAGRLNIGPHGENYKATGVISGAGTLGIVSGSTGANSVIVGADNVQSTFSGGTVVESGATLKLGFKNALGGQGKALRVESGAIFDVNGKVDHGAILTLNGGTIKNSGDAGGDNSVQFKEIILKADSTFDLAANHGLLNNQHGAANLTLNGHVLTKKGTGGLTLSNARASAGTIRLEAGSVRVINNNNFNLSAASLVIAGENVNFSENRALTFKDVTIENSASLQAGQGSFTVNGTLKVDGSIAKVTTIATTGTLDLSAIEGASSAEKITGNLTINSGVAFKFPAGHTGAAYTLCGGTLTAPESYAGQVTVGEEEPFPATLVFDTEAKTVSYATSLTEYALSETDLAAITSANLSYGGVALIDVSSEVSQDIAKEATITGAPDGHVAYGLGSKFIGVIKMNYEEAMEAKLNAAALHFDVSRLNTIAADAQNNVTSLDNLGADSTRAMASLTGNGNSANVSPVMTASNTGIYLDFGAGGTHKDLSWQRLEGIKTVIQVIDLVHDGNKGFFLGDWNSGSGTYGFHRGDSAQYLNTQHCKADYVYDNGVSKDRGADCPTGMRVLSMGETGSDNICSDCFSHDRNQGTRNGGRKLCETVVFMTALSDSERAEIEDYLLRKWFNAKAVVNGVPKTSIQEALDAAEGNYSNVHTLVEPTEGEIPEGWIWQNGTFVQLCTRVDGVDYTSLAEALAHVEGTTTITMLANIVAQGETIPAGVTIDLAGHALTGTLDVETGALITDNGVPKIDGIATSFDITYTNVNAFAYKSITATANQDSSMTYNNTLNDHTTAANLKHHPFVESMTAFYRNTAQLTFAVVGTMPSSTKTTFIHMGETRTANDGGYGLLIATGTKKDEVTVSWNHGTEVNLITTISVPNAATERHVYIVTKDDVDQTSTFRVYLDGKLRKELAIPRITIIGGIQVGSDFGGLLKDLPADNVNHYNQATTGLVNLIRGYDRVISQAEIDQYSVESEYPYHPPFGESSREFASDETTANWIEAEDNTSWSVKAKGATEATATYQPIAGSAVTANFAGATTVTVNVSEEGLTYENLEITGTGPATFVKGANSGEIKVSGKVNVYCPIVIKPGSLDISTPPVELFDTGKITFDYSEFDLSSVVKTTKITLIGSIDRADEKVIFTAPATHPYHTLTVNYDALTGYVLTITPNHEDGSRVYFNAADTYFDGALAGKVELEDGTKTVLFPNDIVVLADGKSLPAWVGKPVCAGIAVETDVTLGMGETSNVDSSNVAPALDGKTITVTDDKTLTLGNTTRSWSLASVTMNGPGAVLVKGTVSATAIAGDATLKLAEGATLTVGTELTVGRVVSNVIGKSVKKEEVADNKTKYSLIDTSTEPIEPSDDPEAEPVVIEDVGTGIAVQPNAKVEIALPAGATTEQKAEIAAKITVKYRETILNPVEGTKYVEVTIGDDGTVNVDTTTAAKPTVTEMSEESESEVSISFTPVPGLFYTLESGDTPNDFTPGDAEQAMSSDTKTLQLSVPTGEAKVKFYRVSVKATK